MIRYKKKIEILKLRKLLQNTNFFSIINVKAEFTEEFFNFKNELYQSQNKLILVKLKKNYYNSLLGLKIPKMFSNLSGLNYLVIPNKGILDNFNDFLAIINTYRANTSHFFSYLSPYICDDERLHRISKNNKKSDSQQTAVAVMPTFLTNFICTTSKVTLINIIYLCKVSANRRI